MNINSVLELRKKIELNTEQAATYLGWKVNTLYNKINAGEGPRRVKRGNRWFFLKEDLDAYLRAIEQRFEAFSK